MKTTLILIICFISTSLFAYPKTIVPDTNENEVNVNITENFDDFFNSANTFLTTYVNNGKVDYTEIKSEAISLKKLTDFIADADLSQSDKNTQIAFYLNAYNLLVIKSVVDGMPLNSPLDVTGFFETKKHNIAGLYLTLNDIENKKLRPDPRIHFAIVCAAKSCPKLSSDAFTPEKVQSQLNSLTKKALNDAAYVSVNDASNTVQVSKIFDWYKDDFIQKSGSVIAFINVYRTAAIATNYTVSYFNYSWDLNIKGK